MTTLAICSTLIGLVLGIRFRFLVLVPILFVGSVSLAAISMTQGQTLLQAISAIVVFAALLQVGYACTALLKSFARAPRANRTVPHAAAGVVVVRKS
ncbi:hypothetical protein [Bradyrhizobium sp. AUGA SZCCT0431]|uniref:hypothetical protein n=1 Tax=Bradyrhizobium sp. AUGA SZCCT0431 TaxID=2807674 RepID=UPI001BAAEEC6|nr:hypothetical protein [Bradyrhizobium sp. AUGA SZCCT0431]MBR1147266.1 hypothetical protein [Bradyrhizobium sp. AUGA SZCCT0431]